MSDMDDAARPIAALEAEVKELAGLLKQAGAECQEWKDEVARLREEARMGFHERHAALSQRAEKAEAEVERLRSGWDRSDILLGEEMERAEKAEAEVHRMKEPGPMTRDVSSRADLCNQLDAANAGAERYAEALERIIAVGGRNGYATPIAEAALATEPPDEDAP